MFKFNLHSQLFDFPFTEKKFPIVAWIKKKYGLEEKEKKTKERIGKKEKEKRKRKKK